MMLIFAVMLPIWWQQKVQPINNQTRTNFMLRSATVLPLLLLNCKESQHFQVISIDIRLHQFQTYGNIHMWLNQVFMKKPSETSCFKIWKIVETDTLQLLHNQRKRVVYSPRSLKILRPKIIAYNKNIFWIWDTIVDVLVTKLQLFIFNINS